MEVNLKIAPLHHWSAMGKKPFVIAGPCSVESEAQVMDTAIALSKLNVSVLRGGIWKPRSRPGSFEGIGESGLKMLKRAGVAAGLPVATEVANRMHVEQAIEAGIDMVWIGARTTVNPFLVQQIADALAGTSLPVLVKNPVNPDLSLWIGALERVNKAGVTQIAAIHRGFSSFENSKYRNAPNWEIPIELKRRIPEIPILCDPSHICGNTSSLLNVSQTAMDLSFDGLMIESHTDPAHALSDAEQQVTPDQLRELLNDIVYRTTIVEDVLMLNILEELRDQIDKIDTDLLSVLSRRMNLARLIGEYKKDNNITILQPERWAEIVRTRTDLGQAKELTPEFVHRIFEFIHQESIHHQTQVMNTKSNLAIVPNEKSSS